jgi:hypothetical protein
MSETIDIIDTIEPITTHLRSTDVLALYTTDIGGEGPRTRSVYITDKVILPIVERKMVGENIVTTVVGHEENVIGMIGNLEFNLYIAIPKALRIGDLMEEMMVSYGREYKSRVSALEELVEQKRISSPGTEELRVMETNLLILSRNEELYGKFNRLRQGDDIPDSDRLEWLKEEMCIGEGFFFIREPVRYEIPKNATVSKTLVNKIPLKFTFDNHQHLQHFLSKFRYDFEVGSYWCREAKERIPGTRHSITILDSDGKDPSLYTPRTNDHLHYIMEQTKLFPHKDHFYQWLFGTHSPITIGRIEPFHQGTRFVLSTGDVLKDVYDRRDCFRDHVSLGMTTFTIQSLLSLGYQLKWLDYGTKLNQLTLDTKKKVKKVVTEKKIPSSKNAPSISAEKKEVYGKRPLPQSTLLSFSKK